MSKALPVVVAVLLGGAALTPIYYASKHPAPSVEKTAKLEGSSAEISPNAPALDKLSYAQGYQMGTKIPAEINAKIMAAGMIDAAENKPSRYSEAEIQKAGTSDRSCQCHCRLFQRTTFENKPFYVGTK